MNIEILSNNKVLVKFEDNTVFYEGALIEVSDRVIKVRKSKLDWCNPHISYLENNSKKNEIIYRKAIEKDLDKINILNLHRYFDKKIEEEVVLEKIDSIDNLVVAEDKEIGLIVGFKNNLKKEKFIIHTYRGLNIEKAL
ncbi:MAG: hypothetical protein ACRCZO_10070 [Cetobacterium sp.]|uniref:hypothetical protein n=1 Tax=Cetobacterium sp. TaxID=2071632 RepID=UPI0025D3B332|nr:hypothetical protein [uncultured Cetobacterium sp.]